MTTETVRFNRCAFTLCGEIEQAAWAVFVSQMQDRQYGPEATRDAWAWFIAGWQAHIVGPRKLPK